MWPPDRPAGSFFHPASTAPSAIPSRMHIKHFPGYAPELNPDEGMAKRALAHSCPNDLGELVEVSSTRSTGFLRRLRNSGDASCNRNCLRFCADLLHDLHGHDRGEVQALAARLLASSARCRTVVESGIRARIRVPCDTSDSIARWPSTNRTRSRMLIKPRPTFAFVNPGSNPAPTSEMQRLICSP